MGEIRDLIPELLISIRDEMRGMREEQRGMRGELRDTNERLGRVEAELHSTNERLGRVEVGLKDLATRQLDAELRFGTAIAELQGATRELIAEVRKLNDRVDNVSMGTMGTAVRDLQQRVGRLEQRAG